MICHDAAASPMTFHRRPRICPRIRLMLYVRFGLIVTGAVPGMAAAQSARVTVRWGAQGVLAATRMDPAPGGDSRKEVDLEQSMITLTGEGLGGHLRFFSALSLDKLTTGDGVLAIGAWGGSFYDREHQHDYVHEAVVSLVGDIGPGGRKGQVGISGGKGLAPFGSDPPMMRPVLHQPVNEHWTQIMDRLLAVLTLRFPRVGFEGALFDNGSQNGQGHPAQSDSAGHNHAECSICTNHRGASRSARVTLWPLRGLEIRGSLATIVGSAHHVGAGAESQGLWNLSTRFDRPAGQGRLVILAEVGAAHAERSYRTVLAEGQWSSGDEHHRFYYRFESTDRPEAPRSADLFRVAPDTLGAPVGVTRWTVHTAGYGFAFRARALSAEPLLELSLGRVASVGTPAVNLDELYGRRTLWSVVLGVRVSLGSPHSMGRYGALARPDHPAHHH